MVNWLASRNTPAISVLLATHDDIEWDKNLAGVKATTAKPLDGQSFKPLLFNDASAWPPRQLFSIKNTQVSIRTDRFRLDAAGKLFDIQKDRGQLIDISENHPALIV